MFDGILLGQYVSGNSFLYILNPVNKILFCFTFMVLIVCCQSIFWTVNLGFIVLLLFFSAKLPFLAVLKGMKTILFFLIITFIMHIFFTSQGQVIFQYSKIIITLEGLLNALLIFFRIFFIIMINSILTLTTQPTEIAWGFQKLLYPFKIFKFPVDEFALMLSLALRFIPVLFQELGKIIDAQKSRGAEFDSPSFIKKILSFPPILIPMFINSFFRAEEIAMAMEARCYSNSQNRTHFTKIHTGFEDLFFVIFYTFITLVYLYLYYFKSYDLSVF
ncbi:MAG: energy-coupling factor transporter transmembrane protein EcfT [Candidatus Muirbacterium halophilum]|nr:energy-coupling factor transporter transmembrane protein EcfT [Candidatus Muirbacterium halophilum]MCK9475756.1 energy-coupling factor transporter transmembrane protein EcfT [Candidatus Muirbacterium halophilum]